MKKINLLALISVVAGLGFMSPAMAFNTEALGDYVAVKGGCPGYFEECELLTINSAAGGKLKVTFGVERRSEFHAVLEKIPGRDDYEFDVDFAEGCDYLGCAKLLGAKGTLEMTEGGPVLTATFRAEFLDTRDPLTPDGVVETTIQFVKSLD